MSCGTNASDFFVAGGTLRPDAPSYVKRPADDELFNLALVGEFCYVLTARQMGKSSLMVRTADRLKEQDMNTTIIDLTKIGVVMADQWYLGLLTRLKTELKLPVDPEDWWQERASLGRVQRFTDFLRDVILAEIEGQVVIFIDEIDTTLKLDFTDDFFAAIRAIYNARADDPEFKRLTFVLLGVTTPADLIKDRTRTPFNIGQGIELKEFSQADAALLQAGLEAEHPGQGEAIFTRIYHWTSGHPYLTQKLCLSVAETENGGWEEEQVDRLVEILFLSEEARKETNLQFVRDGVQTSPNRRQLLTIYRQVYKGEEVSDDERSLDKNRLKLLGLIKSEDGVLKVRNEVYRRVFNLDWIKANTPVNWMRRINIASAVIVLLLVGILGYLTLSRPQQFTEARAQTFVDTFRETTSTDVRVTNLAGLFQIPGYEDRARALFFDELTPEDQVALFEEADLQAVGDQMIIVVQGLYTHLDDSPAGNQFLRLMTQTLRKINDNTVAKNLATEIEQWLAGRYHAAQGKFRYAVEAYDTAIYLNPDNIGTHFDRALAYPELEKYEEAVADFETVLEIVSQTPTAPTPTSSPISISPTHTPSRPTLTSTSPSAVNSPTPTSGHLTSTLVPTLSPAPTSTPTPTAAVSTPTSSAQRFTSSEQIAASVRREILANDYLYYAFYVNQFDYPALSRLPVPHTTFPERKRAQIITYIVQAGDTVQPIAVMFRLEPTTIMWSNPAVEDAPDLLRTGQELIILPIDGVYHTVVEGDTLESIAEKYKVDIEAIISCEYNNLEPPNHRIEEGMRLIVPDGEKPYVPKVVTAYDGPVPEGARGTGRFQWPALGTITQGYWYGHRAIDIGAPTGSAVLAADSGFASFAGWTDVGYGYLIVIDHANGFATYYAHLSNIYVFTGQAVERGQVIGAVGITGWSTGPHLHFEVRYYGMQQNPRAYLP